MANQPLTTVVKRSLSSSTGITHNHPAASNARGGGSPWAGDRPPHLWGLDDQQYELLEGNAELSCLPAHPTIPLYHGKNATDSAMIIDAMDILHSGVVDGFCLVSSDSDYTRLATRIRETGIFVMGIGEKKTPKPFVNACDLFVYTENLVEEKKATQQKRTQTTRAKKTGRRRGKRRT